MNKVLILGSGFSAKQFDDYDYKSNGWTVVAVNNGYYATDLWDYWIHSEDFGGEYPEVKENQIESCILKQ